MRLLKKLTAVAAVAAVCCTMSLPVAAGAGTYGADPNLPCQHLSWEMCDPRYVDEVVDTHNYGNDEKNICKIVNLYLLYQKAVCKGCGMTRVAEYKEYVRTFHTEECGVN